MSNVFKTIEPTRLPCTFETLPNGRVRVAAVIPKGETWRIVVWTDAAGDGMENAATIPSAVLTSGRITYDAPNSKPVPFTKFYCAEFVRHGLPVDL